MSRRGPLQRRKRAGDCSPGRGCPCLPCSFSSHSHLPAPLLGVVHSQASHPGPGPGEPPRPPWWPPPARSPSRPPVAASSSQAPRRDAPTAQAASPACYAGGPGPPRFSHAPGVWGWGPESGRAPSASSPNLDASRQHSVVVLESLPGLGRSQAGSSPARAGLAWAQG